MESRRIRSCTRVRLPAGRSSFDSSSVDAHDLSAHDDTSRDRLDCTELYHHQRRLGRADSLRSDHGRLHIRSPALGDLVRVPASYDTGASRRRPGSADGDAGASTPGRRALGSRPFRAPGYTDLVSGLQQHK